MLPGKCGPSWTFFCVWTLNSLVTQPQMPRSLLVHICLVAGGSALTSWTGWRLCSFVPVFFVFLPFLELSSARCDCQWSSCSLALSRLAGIGQGDARPHSRERLLMSRSSPALVLPGCLWLRVTILPSPSPNLSLSFSHTSLWYRA